MEKRTVNHSMEFDGPASVAATEAPHASVSYERGPLISTTFVPEPRAIAADVPPSFQDYRVVSGCVPKRLADMGS